MRLLVGGFALAAILCAATTVSAQINPQQSQINNQSNIGRHASGSSRDNGEETKPKANDKAYNAALRNLPDKQFDPWGGVRPTSPATAKNKQP
jgi:hypothetical protein